MAVKKRGRGVNATGRSKGKGQFVQIPYNMAHSPAWRSLNGSSIKVYIELRSRFNGSNNGDLSLSMDEGARLLEIGKATVKRAFDELADKGFIVKTRQGKWYGRLATTWAVTNRPMNGNPPTNEWKNWPPGKNRVSVLR